MLKNRVRELRERRGWSQEELAESIKVSRRTISAIENDPSYQPGLLMAFKLGTIFGVSPDTLFWVEAEPVLV
jgi:putative transcriptional regulator